MRYVLINGMKRRVKLWGYWRQIILIPAGIHVDNVTGLHGEPYYPTESPDAHHQAYINYNHRRITR